MEETSIALEDFTKYIEKKVLLTIGMWKKVKKK